ncbi:MAG: NADH-quinone oxidoreductase subunit N [Pirellulales bacterium]
MNVLDLIRENLPTLGPAFALLIAGCGLLLFGIFEDKVPEPTEKRSDDGWGWASLVLILVIWAWWWLSGRASMESSTRLFRADELSRYGIHLAFLGGALITAISVAMTPKKFASEFHGCLLMLLSGLVIVAASNDLMVLYLGLELVSIPTTVLLAVSRIDGQGREATLKYFSLSAFSTTIFLLGASYLFGLSGTTSLAGITSTLSSNSSNLGSVAMALVIAGLAFRITAVPFHFYAPDVFAGSALPLAALLAYLPKVAGFLALARLMGGATLAPGMAAEVTPVLITLSLVTMILGNATALVQTTWRRLLAYSSIAHTGYLLFGLVALLNQGLSSRPLFVYLAAYGAMTLGVFAALASMATSPEHDPKLEDAKGLFRRNPWVAICLTISLLSLIGMPLTAGFWAKLQIFLYAVSANDTLLRVGAMIMAINAVIGAVYYLSALVRLYMEPSETTSVEPNAQPWTAATLACVACAALTLLWFFVPAWM